MKEGNKLLDRFLEVAVKIQNNFYLKAISDGFAALLPLIMVGAIFAVIDSVGIPAYQNFLASTGIKEFLKFPNMVTNGMLSIYVAFSIAYNLAKNYELDEFMSGFVAVMAFMLIQPFGTAQDGSFIISMNVLGAEGIFTAIIAAIMVVECTRFLINHNIYVKMPKGVPEMVERSFKALTTVVLVMALFLTIKIVFAFTSIGTFPNLISMVVQAPLRTLGSSWISFVIVLGVVNLLWFFGIHGHLVALSVMLPVYMQMDVENINAFQAGAGQLPNILGNSFIYVYSSGFCVLAGFVYWLWKAKTKRFQSIAKLSFIPAIFGIGEPLAFGVPYVFNFTLFIPVVCSGMINAVLAYFATVIGILPRLNGANISGLPVMVSGFITGGFRVALFQAALCALNVVIWAMFVKKLDEMEYEKEMENAAEV